MPDIAELSRQVIVDQTPEGLRIQLVDQDGRPMFKAGTSQPMPYTAVLLSQIAKIIDRLPNRISISGHTEGGSAETRLELATFCRAGRRSTPDHHRGAGVNPDRIYEIAGKAGSEPLLPEDPAASANRRVSIVLLREAPPVPPGHKL